MSHSPKLNLKSFLILLGILGLAGGILWLSQSPASAELDPVVLQSPDFERTPQPESGNQPSLPEVFNGDLRDLPVTDQPELGLSPLKYIPGQEPKGSAPSNPGWSDPAWQEQYWAPVMPSPLLTFEGTSLSTGGGGWPPDPQGDVGLEHYIEVVNISVAIFDKATGNSLWLRSFNDFFTGPVGTPCDTANKGDPIVVYDPLVSRWLVSDFAWFSASGPFYECLAVSQGPDPLTDGWYFYALHADTGNFTGYLNDYPKLGVWSDGWYMSANMFQQNPPGSGFGVRLWALDRAAMMAGAPLREVHFDICPGGVCDSLLPAILRGELPAAGTPEYFLSVSPDQLSLWKMHVDWAVLSNSTLTGPIEIPVTTFPIAASVPQPGTSISLDSLSWRLMYPLFYRKINGEASLWALHTVNNHGVATLRWYEVDVSGATPALAQHGTYDPQDRVNRWMGSLAVDRDGNMAVGYSASSSSIYPEIRLTGRLAGEMPGFLTQGETLMYSGSGSQTMYTRWGDYSGMSIDPVDDCTFWYINEYYQTTGTNWHTRIGSFIYPSCDRPKGTLTGGVFNATTSQPIAGVPLVATTPGLTLRLISGLDGTYTIQLPAGAYNLTAGPMLPGYPISVTVPGVQVISGNVTSQNFQLQGFPFLEGQASYVKGGMTPQNSFPEPGESGLQLSRSVHNAGAATAVSVSGEIQSLTSGVVFQSDNSVYGDIQAGSVVSNTQPYQFSVDSRVACGADLHFQQMLTIPGKIFTDTFSINASVPLPRQPAFLDTVEAGIAGWTADNPWAITTLNSYSPLHSWTDSPNGSYDNNRNISLKSPTIDLLGVRKTQITGWISYDLETGYDYLLVEYSRDGGVTWNPTSLYSFTGKHPDWSYFQVDASVLDNTASAAIRFRLVTDASVNRDGVYLDDIALTYEPFVCRRLIFPLIFGEPLP